MKHITHTTHTTHTQEQISRTCAQNYMVQSAKSKVQNHQPTNQQQQQHAMHRCSRTAAEGTAKAVNFDVVVVFHTHVMFARKKTIPPLPIEFHSTKIFLRDISRWLRRTSDDHFWFAKHAAKAGNRYLAGFFHFQQSIDTSGPARL